MAHSRRAAFSDVIPSREKRERIAELMMRWNDRRGENLLEYLTGTCVSDFYWASAQVWSRETSSSENGGISYNYMRNFKVNNFLNLFSMISRSTFTYQISQSSSSSVGSENWREYFCLFEIRVGNFIKKMCWVEEEWEHSNFRSTRKLVWLHSCCGLERYTEKNCVHPVFEVSLRAQLFTGQ